MDCQQLTTIFCEDTWGQTHDQSAMMFMNCYKLVGGQGFAYKDNCTDAAYANLGEQGYFTRYLRGDVNRDGSVTIADVTALVNIILGKATEADNYNYDAADVNTDGSITIADVTMLVNIILGKVNP